MKIGLCYRDSIHRDHIQEVSEYIDFVELMPDITNFKETRSLLNLFKEKNVDVGIHCLKSSLGSEEGFHIPSIEQYAFYNAYANSMYFSDHAAYSHIQGTYLSSVNPINFTHNSAQTLASNLNKLGEYFSEEILVENITQNTLLKNNTLDEGQFFSEVMNLTGNNVKLMFDVTNAYVTANNNGITFNDYVCNYPFNEVSCVHVSGFEKDDTGMLHDTHSHALRDEIICLTESIVKEVNPKYLLLERDFNVNSVTDTLEDITKLKNIKENVLSIKA